MTDQGTLLVVDDLPQNVRLLEAVFEPRGYAVRSAPSGPEALDLLAGTAVGPRAARHRDARAWTATPSAARCATIRRRRSCRS